MKWGHLDGEEGRAGDAEAPRRRLLLAQAGSLIVSRIC